jgi:hypothetical protein
VKKLLLAAAAGLLMAACAEAPSAPTMPKSAAPGASHKDGDCRSGYIIAYDENGNPICAPVDDGNAAMAAPRITPPAQ